MNRLSYILLTLILINVAIIALNSNAQLFFTGVVLNPKIVTVNENVNLTIDADRSFKFFDRAYLCGATGKTEIQNKTKDKLQEVVDLYKMGIQISNVQLQNVDAPDPVKHYFKDVASAKEDMSKYVNQARGYQNEIIPRMRGRAAELIQKAEAYKAQRVNMALGDAKRFTEILKEYEKAPQITEERLYIETMSEIYPNLEKIIIDDKNGVFKFLDLESRTKERK